jgi:hypothetical protein
MSWHHRGTPRWDHGSLTGSGHQRDGRPEAESGFWENISQCCGNAGVIQFALDQKNLDYAKTVAADLMSRATPRR